MQLHLYKLFLLLILECWRDNIVSFWSKTIQVNGPPELRLTERAVCTELMLYEVIAAVRLVEGKSRHNLY